jgi:hypothetical protein
MVKKAILFIIIAIIAAGSALYFYGARVLQYSAESIIRKSLPDYTDVDEIIFDVKGSKLVLKGFKIVNPAGFSYRYLIEIGQIVCRYRMKGKTIIEGIEVLEPEFLQPTVTIERLSDGRLNIVLMQDLLDKSQSIQSKREASKNAEKAKRLLTGLLGSRRISDLVKLPENFVLKNGRILFIDRLNASRPHMITFDNVQARLSLKLDGQYSRVLDIGSSGEGNLNGNRDEVVNWVISYNPTTPKLTMSNRFTVSRLDILAFEPYYDKYSPFVFKKGRFSGLLIFDFDNGNIGSSNEIRISNFVFYIKSGYENASFWQTNVPELARYLTTASGDIVFDFKIKGDISSPKFYLGPKTKEAIAAMTIDKIRDTIQKMSDRSQPSAPGTSSNSEKIQGYINLFKEIAGKK